MGNTQKYDGKFEVVFENKDNQNYPIRPTDIRAGQPGSLLGTFGKSEVETSAEWLVQFFQHHGYWKSFTLEELYRFYNEKGWDFNQAFFGLMGAWYDDCTFGQFREPSDVYIAVDPKGKHRVTDRFINRCADAEDPAAFLRMMGKVTGIIEEAVDKKVQFKKLN